MRLLRKARFIWVYPLAIWLFATAHTTERSLRIGIVLVLLGEAVRLWANGYVGHVKVNWTEVSHNEPKIGRLTTAGPYAYVRHPLYFGTFLIGVGFCVMVGNVWLSVAALGFFLVIYRRKMSEEEATLLHEWGEAFEQYQRAVPRWLPSGRRNPQPHGQWSWQGIAASKELKTFVWAIVLLIAMYFREEMIQRHEPLLNKHGLKHLLLLGAVAALILYDGMSELARFYKRRQPHAVSS